MMHLKEVDWTSTLFIGSYHLLLIIMLPLYLYFRTPSLGLIIATIVLHILTGVSITAGYHRYYAHKSYKPSFLMEVPLLFFGTAATEGDVLSWAHDHRLHHRFVDKDGDPYNIKDGFWHAHIIWMLKKHERNNDKVVKDLMKRKILVFQAKHYGFLMVLTNLIITLFVGWLVNDYWGAFVFAYLLRTFTVHHSTWFINSLAHYYGSQPYSKEHSAVNNFVIAILTLGEGYHNYHHTFANDYRNGVRWWQFDPTKLLIWTCNKLGLAKNLTTVNNYVIKKRLLQEDKRIMLEAIKSVDKKKKISLERRISNMFDKIDSQISKLKDSKGNKAILRKSINDWDKLCKEVLKLNPNVH